MEKLVLELFAVFAPIMSDIIKHYRAEKGHDPTEEEMEAIFKAKIEGYLADGMNWKALHPENPKAVEAARVAEVNRAAEVAKKR